MLEDADASLSRLLKEIHTYHSCFGSYMEPTAIKEEIAVLEAVQPYDKGNEKLAHKIAQLAMAIEDWAKAIESLSPFANSKTVALRRDLGWALWRQGTKEGEWDHRKLQELFSSCLLLKAFLIFLGIF